MKRLAARTDGNHTEVKNAFRKLGCSVADTASCGDGFPDIVVGTHGVTELVEIKDGKKPPSHRKLTPDQQVFHAEWKGSIRVVKDLDEVQETVKSMRERARAYQAAERRVV